MKILFILISFLSGFFLGTFFGGITVPKESGLAGGAMVFGYGVIGGVIALILAIIFVKKIEPKLLKKITIILLILNLIPLGWVIYKFTTNRSEEEPTRKLVPTEAAISLGQISNIFSKKDETSEMGLGMIKPNFYKNRALYFYSPNLEKGVSEHLPSDSVIFSQTEIGYNISYAPPWFYPEHLKMDYEILYLKILTLGRDWIEVEVNKKTNLSTWVSALDVQVLLWPEFLLKVFSIENLDPKNNLLRIKPLDYAGEFIGKNFSILSPVMIKGNWIKVELLDNDINKLGEAWLQWRKDGKLLISYSLLS